MYKCVYVGMCVPCWPGWRVSGLQRAARPHLPGAWRVSVHHSSWCSAFLSVAVIKHPGQKDLKRRELTGLSFQITVHTAGSSQWQTRETAHHTTAQARTGRNECIHVACLLAANVSELSALTQFRVYPGYDPDHNEGGRVNTIPHRLTTG